MADFFMIHTETVLFLTLCGLIAAEIGYHGERHRLTFLISLIGLGAAFLQVLLSFRGIPARVFSGTLAIDGIAILFKLIFLAWTILAIVSSFYSKELDTGRRTEYCSFVVGTALANCFAVSSANALLTFVALQAIGLLSFFLAGHSKKNPSSTEAAIKLMLFSVVSGVLFLIATSAAFTFSHTLDFYEMSEFLRTNPFPSHTGVIVFVLYLVAICFWVGIFPMYLWMPDVLEGAPMPSALFLSFAMPVTGLAVLFRLFGSVFLTKPPLVGMQALLGGLQWTSIIAILSGVTMIMGGLLSLRQKSAKRLIACIVLAHFGSLLFSFLVLDSQGAAALVFNLIVDLFCLIGIFSALGSFVDEAQSDSLSDLKDVIIRLGGRRVPECIALLIFVACFIGLPPFPGFLGRFALIGAVAKGHWYGLVIIATLSKILCAAAFARLAFAMAGGFRKTSAANVVDVSEQRIFLYVLMFPLLLLGVFADRVLYWAEHSLRSIFW